MTYRVGIDIGGTFTDFALWHDGRISLHKNLSTPEDRSIGVMEGLSTLARQEGLELTPAHWEVIHFLRDFYFENGVQAQVRVMIRLPPKAVSIRRMVVPIGSDGVTPQRGWPPSAVRVSGGRSTVIEA